MSTEKKEKRTILQRITRLILGKSKPNFITLVSVIAGFLIWIYFISWHALSLMALTTMDSLKMGKQLVGAFNRVGSSLYDYSDTVQILTTHSSIQLLIYFVILVGLIFIYRQKRIGFILYILGNIASMAAVILILGLKYFQTEIGYFNIILLSGATIYFGLGAIWLYKWKPKREQKNSINAVEESN